MGKKKNFEEKQGNTEIIITSGCLVAWEVVLLIVVLVLLVVGIIRSLFISSSSSSLGIIN